MLWYALGFSTLVHLLALLVALVSAFNEERYVASVLVRLRECVDRVIVCDDGSANPGLFLEPGAAVR